jgi:hypothetical protein
MIFARHTVSRWRKRYVESSKQFGIADMDSQSFVIACPNAQRQWGTARATARWPLSWTPSP